MSHPSILTLSCRLAAAEGREEAARVLAQAVGAEALLAFVLDAEVGLPVPAPGFRRTLPPGPTWPALLANSRKPGLHRAEVAWPDDGARTAAVALTLEDGSTFVFVGGAPALPSAEALGLPLLSAALRAEATIAAQRGELNAERDAARRATTLAHALDRARRELETALAESARLNEALATASRAKDEFLAMLGHELRNPLAPIVTALQLLRLRAGEALRPEHAVIERHVGHLSRLVDDLLDVSRITRGKVTLHRRPIRLGDVVLRALEMAAPLLEERRHKVTVDVSEDGPWVDVDEARLAQVVSNLLTNAARYTPPHGEVRVRAFARDGRAHVCVQDTGIGIEPSLLENVFELFVQGKQSRSREMGGLGLGLAIVKSLVALHDGDVQVRSDGPGKGAEFEVTLPLTHKPVATPVQRPEPEATAKGARQPPRLRVLVVDDTEDAAQLLGEALEMQGFDVQVCHDGPAALEASPRFRPDVAILDIGLPVMDGFELARRMRAVLPEVRLIAATGYGLESDKRLTRDAGFTHHLVKPLNLDAVVDALTQDDAPLSRDGRSKAGETGAR